MRKNLILLARLVLLGVIGATAWAVWHFRDIPLEPPQRLTDAKRIQKIGWLADSIKAVDDELREIAKEFNRETLKLEEAIKLIESGERTVNTPDAVSAVADPRNNVVSREKLRENSRKMIADGKRQQRAAQEKLSKLKERRETLNAQLQSYRQQLAQEPDLKTWHSVAGQSFNAHILDVKGNTITVVDNQGKQYQLPFEQVIPQDRAYATLFALGYCAVHDFYRAFEEGNLRAIAVYQEMYGNDFEAEMRKHSKLERALKDSSSKQPAVILIQALAKGAQPQYREAGNPDTIYFLSPDGENAALVSYLK